MNILLYTPGYESAEKVLEVQKENSILFHLFEVLCMCLFPACMSGHTHVVPVEARRDDGSPGTGNAIAVE